VALRTALRLLLVAGTLGLPGCSWHRPGEADAVAPPPSDARVLEPGASLGEVLAWAEARESGEFSVDADLERVVRVSEGLWEDVPLRKARAADFAPDAAADYVVVVRRSCRDWEGRERWSDERASWFLLPSGRLVAFDHWTFGPRCALGNAFRPPRASAHARAIERDLLRWLEQRHPPGRVPTEIRFQRGMAYVASGRRREARAMLRFGDDALQSREDLFEKRIASPEEAEAFELEGRRLRALRNELRAAIQQADQALRQRCRFIEVNEMGEIRANPDPCGPRAPAGPAGPAQP
jgi:hypothetical protein